jgi:hypothetical protein
LCGVFIILDRICEAIDNMTMRDKEFGKLLTNRNSLDSVLKTLKHRLRLRKTRMFDLTTKHSIDQPLQKWEWPKGTWLQNRLQSARNMKDPASRVVMRHQACTESAITMILPD